jgi:hypothetical protein
MSNQMVPRSSYTTHSITKGSAIDIQDVAQHSAKATEIAKVANEEQAKIGAHAISTMAQLTSGAGQVRQQLTTSGYRSEIFDDAQNKVLQVTGQNLITMTNAAQKEVLQYAASRMRE